MRIIINIPTKAVSKFFRAVNKELKPVLKEIGDDLASVGNKVKEFVSIEIDD